MVRVDGMTAKAWEIDGKSGVSFRAVSVGSTALGASGQKAAA
jgi:hypothetical protein